MQIKRAIKVLSCCGTYAVVCDSEQNASLYIREEKDDFQEKRSVYENFFCNFVPEISLYVLEGWE